MAMATFNKIMRPEIELVLYRIDPIEHMWDEVETASGSATIQSHTIK